MQLFSIIILFLSVFRFIAILGVDDTFSVTDALIIVFMIMYLLGI